jgi:hypothetical protein
VDVAKQLELCDDGRVIIRTRTQEWILERPTLGEYRVAVEEAEAIDASWVAALDAIEDPAEKIRHAAALQMGTAEQPPIYGALIRDWIGRWAEGEPPDVDDLPSWAVTGKAVTRMIAHWRAVPLDLGPSVEAR